MRVLLMAGCACLLAADAGAGAWTLAEGTGQVITTTGRRIAPVGAFLGGLARADSNYSHVFVEYGLGDAWTVGASAYGEFSALDLSDIELRVGAHVRRRVWQRQAGDVVSVQAGIGLPVESWLGSLAPESLPDSVPEAEIRALYGRGWQWGWGDSFVSAELGYRWRGEGAADDVRIDATAGHEAWKGVLALFSVFSAIPVQDGGEASLKLAPSVAYTIWPWLGENEKKPFGPVNPNTVQLGVLWDALNPEDGLGVQISLWKSF